MALISAKKHNVKEKIKLDIDKEIYNEIEKYCAWEKIDDISYFFEEAASYILSKDKTWKAYKSKNKPA